MGAPMIRTGIYVPPNPPMPISRVRAMTALARLNRLASFVRLGSRRRVVSNDLVGQALYVAVRSDFQPA